jgi:site-specific DNA recombinase
LPLAQAGLYIDVLRSRPISVCGVCGGGFTITAKDRYGCARRGRQGTCSNSRGIKRQELERRVLDGLRSSLVTPHLVAEFITEYQAEWNRLQNERHVAAGRRDRQLANVKRRVAGMVEAIERGIITRTTKQRLEELEAEQVYLEVLPVEAPLPAVHPNLARLYAIEWPGWSRNWPTPKSQPRPSRCCGR